MGFKSEAAFDLGHKAYLWVYFSFFFLPFPPLCLPHFSDGSLEFQEEGKDTQRCKSPMPCSRFPKFMADSQAGVGRTRALQSLGGRWTSRGLDVAAACCAKPRLGSRAACPPQEKRKGAAGPTAPCPPPEVYRRCCHPHCPSAPSGQRCRPGRSEGECRYRPAGGGGMAKSC